MSSFADGATIIFQKCYIYTLAVFFFPCTKLARMFHPSGTHASILHLKVAHLTTFGIFLGDLWDILYYFLFPLLGLCASSNVDNPMTYHCEFLVQWEDFTSFKELMDYASLLPCWQAITTHNVQVSKANLPSISRGFFKFKSSKFVCSAEIVPLYFTVVLFSKL